MKTNFWKKYWEDKTNGEHRLQDETFLECESKEKLFHLSGGRSILDFGCGSADLLSYYAPLYDMCIGVDGSKSMIEKANERLKHFNRNNVTLAVADDSQLWEYIRNNFGENAKFDRITTGQLIQYLSLEQIDNFISNSKKHLSDKGQICLFDVVDSRLYHLWRAGLFKSDSLSIKIMIKIIASKLRAVKNAIIQKPKYDLGYIYPPKIFNDLAAKYNFKVSFASSMFYEYRYHVIFENK